MVDVIVNKRLDQHNIAKLDFRQTLIELLGITDYAAQKAIAIFNGRSEPSEKKRMGRPPRQLKPEYISAVKELVDKNNKEGRVSTVRSLSAALEEQRNIVVSYDVLLKDLHTMKLTYKKGERRNILHDSPANIEYRYRYSNERLKNQNGNKQPIQPEVFLDESYCHLDHHVGKTWALVRGVVNERGRKPMMVMFAAFVVFKSERKLRAKMIEDSIQVWPAKNGKKLNLDYHGNFTSDIFEDLLEKLCQSLVPYGSCIIHMDGASYHKRMNNPFPKTGSKRKEIEEWLVDNGHLQEQDTTPKKNKKRAP